MSISKLQAYAIYDVKTQLYSHPHFLQTNGNAIRSFAQACEDEKSDLNKYAKDFSLYHIGEYDLETGNLKTDQPKQIATAMEFITKPDPLDYKTLSDEIQKIWKQLKINSMVDGINKTADSISQLSN